jgi:UTP--glucose-1-phosphate uridylyltransferase
VTTPRQRARKAVITAAGRGTRQFPATRSFQKELLPLVDRDGVTKPTIQIIVEECLQSGIEDVCIVVAKGEQRAFANHFRALDDAERRAFAGKEDLLARADRLAEMARRVTYVEQPSPEGFGHAVYQARAFVGDEPFLLLLGDHVYTTPPGIAPCAAQLLDIGERENGSVTSVRIEPEAQVGITGVVRGARGARRFPGAGRPRPDLRDRRLRREADAGRGARARHAGIRPGFYLCHFGLHLFRRRSSTAWAG